MEIFDSLHFSGLIIGICTFLIIGFFHPVVVKCEYYFGTRCCVGSLLTDHVLASTLLGVFAFSSFWTIKEIFEQEERVKKGWFPKNPKRTYKF